VITRAISAFLGVAALFATWFFWAAEGLVTVCCLVTLVACIEFSNMVEKKKVLVQSLFVVVTFAFFLVFTFFSQSFLTFMSLFIILVSYFILCVEDSIPNRVAKLTSWTVGALYCGGFTGIVTHGTLVHGGNYFVGLLLLSFLTDTFAYLGGRILGRTPLAPQISPKKTIEGSIIGLLGGAGCGYWFLSGIEHQSPAWVLLTVCVASSLFSQVGDLFESTIKRYSGVKDSGKILPGHGGVLDRIDGLLFVGPVLALWMQAFAQLGA
jgi:phosphatidate cytidylyltransferase